MHSPPAATGAAQPNLKNRRSFEGWVLSFNSDDRAISRRRNRTFILPSLKRLLEYLERSVVRRRQAHISGTTGKAASDQVFWASIAVICQERIFPH